VSTSVVYSYNGPVNPKVCIDHFGAILEGHTTKLRCNAVGRYVQIKLKGNDQLSLCEVEIHGSRKCDCCGIFLECSYNSIRAVQSF
jgi:hypothetical protein